MRLSLAFVTLLAAVPTLATVVPSPRVGTVIPLNKRAKLLVDAQGVVKPDALRGQISKVAGKLNRGFQAFQKNTGQSHPAQTESLQLESRATGTDALVDEQDKLWQGTITVGTPPKQFTVDFDTGSSDLFLPGAKCGSTCRGHQIYDTTRSSTARDQGARFSLGFGDGSTVQGEIFQDTVTIGGLTATGQAIGAATQYSTEFEFDQSPPDGLMGMAFEEISEFGKSPFFQTLVAQKKPTAGQFSFKLAESGSELFLGGTNSKLFTGSFTDVSVTQKGFWQVKMDSANVNGKAAASNLQAVIDTGTTFIVAPQSQVSKFYKAIPGSKAAPNLGDGIFTFPCKANPNISLTFGGKQFAIAPEFFNLGQASPGSPDCVGAITGTSGISFWVVGDVFLRNVYTKFDVGNNQVGFAKLA